MSNKEKKQQSMLEESSEKEKQNLLKKHMTLSKYSISEQELSLDKTSSRMSFYSLLVRHSKWNRPPIEPSANEIHQEMKNVTKLERLSLNLVLCAPIQCPIGLYCSWEESEKLTFIVGRILSGAWRSSASSGIFSMWCERHTMTLSIIYYLWKDKKANIVAVLIVGTRFFPSVQVNSQERNQWNRDQWSRKTDLFVCFRQRSWSKCFSICSRRWADVKLSSKSIQHTGHCSSTEPESVEFFTGLSRLSTERRSSTEDVVPEICRLKQN